MLPRPQPPASSGRARPQDVARDRVQSACWSSCSGRSAASGRAHAHGLGDLARRRALQAGAIAPIMSPPRATIWWQPAQSSREVVQPAARGRPLAGRASGAGGPPKEATKATSAPDLRARRRPAWCAAGCGAGSPAACGPSRGRSPSARRPRRSATGRRFGARAARTRDRRRTRAHTGCAPGRPARARWVSARSVHRPPGRSAPCCAPLPRSRRRPPRSMGAGAGGVGRRASPALRLRAREAHQRRGALSSASASRSARGVRGRRRSQRLASASRAAPAPARVVCSRTSSRCSRAVLAALLGAAWRTSRPTAPTMTRSVLPPTHMIAPACCWSLTARDRRARGSGAAYGGYTSARSAVEVGAERAPSRGIPRACPRDAGRERRGARRHRVGGEQRRPEQQARRQNTRVLEPRAGAGAARAASIRNAVRCLASNSAATASGRTRRAASGRCARARARASRRTARAAPRRERRAPAAGSPSSSSGGRAAAAAGAGPCAPREPIVVGGRCPAQRDEHDGRARREGTTPSGRGQPAARARAARRTSAQQHASDDGQRCTASAEGEPSSRRAGRSARSVVAPPSAARWQRPGSPARALAAQAVPRGRAQLDAEAPGDERQPRRRSR